MNAKVYLIGLGGGILLGGALYYPLYRYLPTLITAEWPPAELSLARAGLGLAAKPANTLAGTRPPREEWRNLWQAGTSTPEEEINQLVALHQLPPTGMIYGLCPEEIEIVEWKG